MVLRAAFLALIAASASCHTKGPFRSTHHLGSEEHFFGAAHEAYLSPCPEEDESQSELFRGFAYAEKTPAELPVPWQKQQLLTREQLRNHLAFYFPATSTGTFNDMLDAAEKLHRQDRTLLDDYLRQGYDVDAKERLRMRLSRCVSTGEEFHDKVLPVLGREVSGQLRPAGESCWLDGCHRGIPELPTPREDGIVRLQHAIFDQPKDEAPPIPVLARNLEAAKSDKERKDLTAQLASLRPRTEADVDAMIRMMTDDKLVGVAESVLNRLTYEDRHWAPVFIKAMESRRVRTLLMAIGILGRFRSQESVPTLRAIAEGSSLRGIPERGRDTLAGKALISLGEIGDETAIPIMMRRLKYADPLREMAGIGLQRLGKKAVAPLLSCARESNDTETRDICAVLILGIRDKEAAPALLQAAQDRTAERKLRGYVIAVLGRIGEEKSLDKLADMFESEDKALKVQVLRAFIYSRNRKGLSLARAALHDKAILVRATAANLLGAIGDESVMADLINALSDSDPVVRISAAQALEKVVGEDFDVGKRARERK